ncbi:MAG: hypothetical protein H0V65_01750, partial [Chitinophagales bacterium]|nr:hypothetical protein [Chitinophagales bacterium]
RHDYGYMQREMRNVDMNADGAAAMQMPANDGVKKQDISNNTSEANNRNEPIVHEKFDQIAVRKNLQETAFFFPQLQTDKDGNVIIKFTMAEALTRWKFLGFAHTKDLKYGIFSKEITTQKNLMVVPNAPRFFREGDEIFFTAKVTNLTDNNISGSVILQLFDAATMKPIDSLFSVENTVQPFNAGKKQSAAILWKLKIPAGIQAVDYKVIATAGDQSDGEENVVPVLTDKILVTETLPLNVRGNTTKNYSFSQLLKSTTSSTIKNHNLTLEFTSNPLWYAVQALPYLMEYPYQSSEQTFNRFYANALAAHIASSNPKIKQVFDQWNTVKSDALLSNLEKNQELKSVLLQETPWLLQAEDETARKKRIALLFDINRTSYEMKIAIKQLEQMQLPNGGWSWFSGGPDDRYITQYIVAGFGHLQHLNALPEEENSKAMLTKAIHYSDNRMREDYEKLIKNKAVVNDHQLNYAAIHYLYARSFYPEIPLAEENRKAVEYYQAQSRLNWNAQTIYAQGMIALGLYRSGDKKTSAAIIHSLKENAIFNVELGMYWKSNSAGYYWYEAPIEVQALLIEAFDEIANDTASVMEMKLWLLKQKQTNNWRSTKATAEAVYALLIHGNEELMSEPSVTVSLGSKLIDISDEHTEGGTGYLKKSWNGSDVIPEMGNITVSTSNSANAVSWGAVYWQYLENQDKIANAATALSVKKKLFLLHNTESGPVMEPVSASTEIRIGNLIKVRIELRTDRSMEYIHLKDMHASGFEPVNVLSEYKWQDGFGYYEETGDASTNFFIDRLPKGTYIFEYALRAQLKGEFS